VPTVHGDAGNPAVPAQLLPWQVHAASAIGASHVRDGSPNQDSAGHRLATRPDGSAVLAVAVADGHGDGRHFRSARGSTMAVAAGLDAVAAWSAPVAGGVDAVQDSAGAVLVPDIVARWDAAVEADLGADPFSDAERTLLARESLPGVIAYGSTLLVAVFTTEYALFTQIGDGNIVAVRPEGRAISPVPADDTLDGWLTTSLCQDDAVAAFRTGAVPLDSQPLLAVLLATDGFGNAQVDDPWQPGFAADLAQLGQDHEPGWFASQLPEWAAQCASAGGSGDDTTLALVIRPAPAPGSGAGPAAAQDAATVTLGPVPAIGGSARAIPGRRAGTDPAATADFAAPAGGYATPAGAYAARPPGQPAAGTRRPGRDGGTVEQRRLQWWWLVAGIAVVLGGIGLVFALTGHSQPGPAPQPPPTHQAAHQPQPAPHKTHKTPKSHKTHKTHKTSKTHPHASHSRRHPARHHRTSPHPGQT
jgi:hypothetical protein